MRENLETEDRAKEIQALFSRLPAVGLSYPEGARLLLPYSRFAHPSTLSSTYRTGLTSCVSRTLCRSSGFLGTRNS